jgi:hypothetical protein
LSALQYTGRLTASATDGDDQADVELATPVAPSVVVFPSG